MDLLTFLRYQWDRAGAWLLVVAGAALLVAGWLGASRQLVPAGQIPYVISGGLGGVFLLGLAAVLWLSADLRDEWRQLHEIAAKLDADRDGDGGSSSDIPERRGRNGSAPAVAEGSVPPIRP